MEGIAKAPTIDTFVPGTVKPPESSTRLVQSDYTKEGIMQFLKEQSVIYGTDFDQMKETITCESSWNVFADNGISYGLLQFTPETWKDYGYGDIMNPYAQIEVAVKMWSRGLQKRWDCWRMLYN